jgi:hypothetical protein
MKLMEKEKISKLNQVLDNEDETIRDLSYSRVSDFDRNGPIALIRPKKEETQALKIGSLVDNLLFETKEFIKKEYYVFDGVKPTETLGILCDIIIKNYSDIPSEEQVLQIIAHNKLWSNIKDVEKLKLKFNGSDFWEYLKCMFETVDKVIVTTKDMNDANELKTILETHKYSRDIIFSDLSSYNQFYFEFKYLNFNFRGLIDKILVDHKTKKVRLIDLKTGTDSALEFENSFIKWRYYFQGTIYTLAFNTICSKLGLVGYTLDDFEFLYISKKEKIPILFKMSKNWFNAGIKGFSIGKYRYKGLNEICEEITWCVKNNEYEIPKSIVESNGELYLKDNFIELSE